MSTYNIGFYEDLKKIIFELSSNIIKYAPYFFCCQTQDCFYSCLYLFMSNLVENMENKFSHDRAHICSVMREPAFCICENKGADQLNSAFVFAI